MTDRQAFYALVALVILADLVSKHLP